MLTMTVTPPAVVFMIPAPTLALALQCSGFLPQGPKSHGAWGLEGEGAGKPSTLDRDLLDSPRLKRPSVLHRRTPSSLSSSPPCCCGASRPCSPPSFTTRPSSKLTGHGETLHMPCALGLLRV